jgi:ketosteroid isomerase-like protein
VSTIPPPYQTSNPMPPTGPTGPASPMPWAPNGPTSWPPQTLAGAPPPPPGSSGSRRVLVLVVLVLVLAVAGIVGGAYLLTQGGDDTASPEEAVVDYRAALESRDCDRVFAFWTDDFVEATFGTSRQEAQSRCTPDVFAIEDVTLGQTELISQDGDQATVEMAWTGEESGEMVSTVDLVLTDGRWRIDSIDESPA